MSITHSLEAAADKIIAHCGFDADTSIDRLTPQSPKTFSERMEKWAFLGALVNMKLI
jgi:hypothetical protein